MLLCHPGCSAEVRSQLTATFTSQVKAILLTQPPEELGLQVPTIMPAQSIFIFLVEMGFHYVGQFCLEFLTSSDPPALASQIARITGLSPPYPAPSHTLLLTRTSPQVLPTGKGAD